MTPADALAILRQDYESKNPGLFREFVKELKQKYPDID